MTDGHERRAEPRLERVEEVTITVDSASGAPHLEGKVFHCRSGDISLRGVRLHVEEFLQVNSYLKVSVKLSKFGEKYRHTGRVVWCRKSAHPPDHDPALQYDAGIEFHTTANPQFNEWRTAILRMLEGAYP